MRVPEFLASLSEGVPEAIIDVVCVIVLTLLFLLGNGWPPGGHPFEEKIQNFCRKRKAAAAVASSQTTQTTAAWRDRIEKEKSILMNKFCKHAEKGETEDMMHALKEVEKLWLPCFGMPDYHCVIQRLARTQNPITAHMWLRRCMAAGLQPYQITFNALISSYVKKKDFTHAMQVVDQMQSAGVGKDTATYNMIMDVWARTGDVHRAHSWMKKMLDEGVPPNIISFSTVMRACAEAGWLEELQSWFETSQKYGFQLDRMCFRSVLRAFAKRQDSVNAMKWLEVMIEYGVQPGIIDCMQVLNPVPKDTDIGLAARLLDRMRAAGVLPSALMLSECIVLAAKSGHHSLAQTWATECVERKEGIAELARTAMVEAGLTVPNVVRDPSMEPIGAYARDDATKCPAERTCFGAHGERHRAAIGGHYVGIVKEANPYRYGFIRCTATYEIFQQDVFFGREENKHCMTKGQRVSFILRLDVHGRPTASDVKLCN